MNSIVAAPPRTVVHRTRGSSHGPITRLMSPGDLGQHLKPFVFLDIFDFDHRTHALHPSRGDSGVRAAERRAGGTSGARRTRVSTKSVSTPA